MSLVNNLLSNLIRFGLLVVICITAYYIRLKAVFHYGRVIHEFDPWFNFRATQYLVDNGLDKFLNWFDDQSWYPIGRHVGSTVYPGLMVTSSLIFQLFNYLELGISLNDICVFIPAAFAVLTTLFTAGMAYEATRSANVAVATAALMAILPAHLMRSVAGGYDNESVALTAIVATFYFWNRSLRTPSSWPWAIPCALSYFYMVSAWGAYPFVLNMIGVHVVVLILLGRFSSHLHLAYSIFFAIGTTLALQLQIVGTQPLTSLEQMGPLGVFFGIQVLRFLFHFKAQMDAKEFVTFRNKVFAVCVLIGAIALAYLAATKRLGAFSTRVKSLFIPHTRTGNPLVDSVAEHQATPSSYYWQYFHVVSLLAPVGLVGFLLAKNDQKSDAKYFAAMYVLISYYFSQKMVRLVLLLSPAAAVAAGYGLWNATQWVIAQAFDTEGKEEAEKKKKKVAPAPVADAKDETAGTPSATDKTKKKPAPAPIRPPSLRKQYKATTFDDFSYETLMALLNEKVSKNGRQLMAVCLLFFLVTGLHAFVLHSFEMSEHLSQTHLVLHARGRDGNPVLIDDFREAYWYLRDNTPEDSRVMAWWDYGYQINGIANRTTIADGNTWNHEHIALLGRTLVSPEKEAHRLARHLADYVLVWTTRFAGMYGDDLAKMPHMANIAGSVYPEIPRTGYHMSQNGEPSPLMKESLLYQLSTQGIVPGVPAPQFFKEVYTSKNRMVRIYQVLNVAKRGPFGKYPPQLPLGQFKQ